MPHGSGTHSPTVVHDAAQTKSIFNLRSSGIPRPPGLRASHDGFFVQPRDSGLEFRTFSTGCGYVACAVGIPEIRPAIGSRF
jgi:hypothetical protein